jgi:TolA-binding protein
MGAIRYPLAMSLLHLERFDEAMGAIQDALGSEPGPSLDQREDLTFYLGVCQMQAEELDGARATFDEFVRTYPGSKQAEEAALLAGTAFLLQGKNAEAADHFAAVKGGMNEVNRGRASVLELYGLLQAGERDRALALVVTEFPRMNEMLQIATFQTLSLQLGSEFLEAEEWRKAIQCLQRVWSSDRLMKYQRARLDDLADGLAAAEAQPKGDPYRKFQLGQMIAKIEREIANFAKVESFDAALRLRLATAFQAMERYRESALILEEMLAEMKPDAVVEAATANLIQCWSAIERWPKAVAAAETFEETFPQSAQLPLVLYLKGIALQREARQPEAISTFAAISKKYPKSEFAPRAVFMRGFSELLAERNLAAVGTFDEFARAYPDHELADPAAYWRGMGFSLEKQYQPSRAAMDAYLETHPTGASRGLAVFRKGYDAQAMQDFDTSIPELRDYLTDHPGHESNPEALLLLGDAHMNGGQMDDGIAAFKRIPPEETRFFEEGWFKIGKALRLLEDVDGMRAHFEQFAAEHPRSPRVAEAIYWIGWTYRQQGEPERAREVYWTAIGELGNDPAIRSVDELFPALAKLYNGPEESAQHVARLRDVREEADGAGEETLGMRALWAQARALVGTQPAMARETMLEAAKRVDVSSTNPLLVAEFASALEAAGRDDDAEQMWRDLVKWNPRAPQKDAAFAALGELENRRGNDQAALGWFDRFEKETFGSVRLGSVLLAKAKLLVKRGDFDAARVSLEALLASEYSTGVQKAEALYGMGQSYLNQKKPELAVPYFQRIYILHGRWNEWVAKAYVRSGEAFEQLRDTDAARKTYDEMTKLERLEDRPEMKEARERLKALGGPVVES